MSDIDPSEIKKWLGRIATSHYGVDLERGEGALAYIESLEQQAADFELERSLNSWMPREIERLRAELAAAKADAERMREQLRWRPMSEGRNHPYASWYVFMKRGESELEPTLFGGINCTHWLPLPALPEQP